MADLMIDTAADSIRLLPFLFVTYFLMEQLEHHAGERAKKVIGRAGRLGPIWGGLLGIVPQCGFSAAAASLYAGHVITVGTLLAVFLSTSDEMIPIFVSEAVPFAVIAKILAVKVVLAVVSGLAAEACYVKVLHKQEHGMDIHTVCEEEHCHCEDGALLSACKHTIRIFLYILLISFALNLLMDGIGEENLAGLLSGFPVVGELLAALVGMIPNCASSVVITELYVRGVIGAGPMMAGLLVNAGVGVLVLLRLNRNVRQNLGILASLYGFGVFWGIVIEWSGIAF